MTPLRQRMLEDMRVRNLAPKTQRTYVDRVAQFARPFGKSPEQLAPEDIRAYQVSLVERRASWSVFNQSVCALRFLYRTTVGQEWAVQHIPFPKQEKNLPVVLSLAEVSRFFEARTSRKPRAILMTAYAAGLRISEVTALRVPDLERSLLDKVGASPYATPGCTPTAAASNSGDAKWARHALISKGT